MSKKSDKKADTKDVGTTGHNWDGIEELNNPLPRWWVWVFYATIVWGVGYTIAYPAWPLIKGATPGLLGYSTRAEVAKDIAAVDEANAELMTQLAAADLSTITDNPELHGFAVNGGRAIFASHCSQCHGSGAAGVQAGGYPNLLDDDWLWGGLIDDIAYVITHGIRNEQSPDALYSQMPAFGTDDLLDRQEIDAVVEHVLALSNQDHDAALAAIGAEVFYDNCAACHGDNGEGMQDLGAPNLSDAIWLYGGDRETIYTTVYESRFGVMPAWSSEYRPGGGLNQAQINAVSAYVHQLGGGQ